jgi:hypothetical protein
MKRPLHPNLGGGASSILVGVPVAAVSAPQTTQCQGSRVYRRRCYSYRQTPRPLGGSSGGLRGGALRGASAAPTPLQSLNNSPRLVAIELLANEASIQRVAFNCLKLLVRHTPKPRESVATAAAGAASSRASICIVYCVGLRLQSYGTIVLYVRSHKIVSVSHSLNVIRF